MFSKKIISLIVTLALTLCFVFIGGQVAFAKADVDPEDQSFIDFIVEDTGIDQITYTHTRLYDQNLQPNGRQYVFTVGNVQGYALTAKLIIGDQVFYEVEELYYNRQAPFTNYQGLPVYITFNTYLDCVDGAFYDIANARTPLSNATVDALAYKGFGYNGSANGTYTESSETVTYATKTTDSYSFPYEAPNLFGSENGSCCANNAGAVVIAYYDRFFENLMPNFQAYFVIGTVIRYRSVHTELSNLVETMRVYMAVDGVPQGTTFTGFQQGMNRYVAEKGYTYSTTSVMNFGALNLSLYKQTVQQEVPVALFLNGYTMINGITESEGQDTINNGHSTATHVEVGIGYKCETYYNANGGVITTRNYLKVVSGLNSYEIGYLNISANANSQLVHAIAIDIN